jgi:rod shape determining protein RodA
MIFPIFLLSILGIVVIYSSSPILALQQVIFTVVGLGIFYFLRQFHFRSLAPVIKPLYFIVLALLVVVFLLGVETRGSLRWIPLGVFNLQPSEFAKPVIILALAYFWSRNVPSWMNILKSLGIVAPVLLLIFKQPDLGTTLTILFIWIVMLLSSNISALKILMLAALGALVTPVGWFFLRGYQKERFMSFLSPAQDPQGIGYNVIQSTIAVGSGQLSGRGLGHGTQSRLQFLPEFRTDFIFASIAEELGLLGSLIVIVLYLLVFYFLFRILARSGDRFGELITIGVAAMLFIQIIVNIGMNAGVMPITGITLPLLSYGGSSVLTVLISLGLVSSVEKYGLKKKEILRFSL